MEIKKLDILGKDFIMREEGFKLKPYKDTSGIPTIGVGMTYYPDTDKRVTMKDKPLTREQALRYFNEMVKSYEIAVWSVTRDDINQNQFNALVDICYNIGVSNFKSSTLLKRVNANPGNVRLITEAFEMWRYDEGKPILLPRRQRDVGLYFRPV